MATTATKTVPANTKNYDAALVALVKLDEQIRGEFKLDRRFAYAADRTARLVSLTKIAREKYLILRSKKVPAKIAAKIAKSTKTKAAAPKAKAKSNVVKLHKEKVAA